MSSGMILGIAGRSVDPQGRTCSLNSGKDTVADELCRIFDCIKIAFADEMKRFLYRMGVPEENLWGPSHKRNEPLAVLQGKSSRHALQTLGTEWGRDQIGSDLWIDRTMRVARSLQKGNKVYSRVLGPVLMQGARCGGVVISDVRFPNEMEAIRARGGQALVVTRPVKAHPKDVNLDHPSERLLADMHADLEILNDGSLEDLKFRTRSMYLENRP